MSTIKDDVVRTHTEHPEWTARQIAAHLGIERYHVYNNARVAGLTLAAPTVPLASTLPATVEPAAAPATDFIVYANNPSDMVAAQKSMIEWCDQKLQADASELEEARRNLDAAIQNGWSSAAWERQEKLIRQKLDFYEKVKLALEAGYYIVPPFPVDIFAIRTTRNKPDRHTSQSRYSQHLQAPQMLPAGEGRYVSDQPTVYQRQIDDPAGTDKSITEYFAKDFRDVEFPFRLAKAEIMSAARAAMELGVFDQMGSLPGGRRTPDPIICGQILMPHRHRQPLTFFVSWWLDTRTL